MRKVKILDVCDVYQPQTIATKEFINDGCYTVYGANGPIGKYTSYNHENAEVVMACRGATCGAINITAPYSWINGNAMVIHPNGTIQISQKYLMYYLTYANKESIITGTAQPQITRQNMKFFEISICSITEQERIVAKIEELFSELDNAVETLKKTKQQLEVYRQAVLQDAFSGTITQSWRNNNDLLSAEKLLENIINEHKTVGYSPLMEHVELPALPLSWKWVSIGDISTGAEYGSSKKSDVSGIVPVLRMGNIQNGQFVMDDLVYSNDVNEIEKYMLSKGDVLFNRTNSPELVGKTASFTGDYPAIFAGYLIRINQVPQIDYRYLTYYLNSQLAKQYGNKVKTDGVNQSNINSKKLYSYPLPLCDVAEQKQIVYELESRLSVCDNIEKTVDTALAQAEAMRQSILKKAFEGELI